MVSRKVCLLGAYGVGKTSLVRQFVHAMFDERYHSTIGVRIDRKDISIDGRVLTLVIWDIAGEEAFHQVPTSYVRGAAGCLLVIDGTRPQTLDTARTIASRVGAQLGPVPMVALLNKSDLTADWRLPAAPGQALAGCGWPGLLTSARTGAGVEEAFVTLARALADPAVG